MTITKLPYPLMALLVQTGDTYQRLIEQTAIGTYKGMTGPIAEGALYLLVMIYSIIGNFGLAIILVAILVRLLLLSLTMAQIRTMQAQQYLGPLTKKIQQRHKGDKQTQNQLMMQLYQKFKLNPLAGCLGMAVQLPIFFGIYRALYDRIFLGHSFLGMQLLFPMNLYFARSFGGSGVDLQKIFDYINTAGLQSHLWQWWALPGTKEHGWQFGWGACPLERTHDLATAAQWAAQAGIQHCNKVYEWALYWPALALVVLYVGSTFVMQNVMRRANEPDPAVKALFEADKQKNNDGKPQAPDIGEQMQKQMKFMTVFLVVIAFILSAGALLYFMVQNLLMIAEYTYLPRLTKMHHSADDVRELMDAIDKGKLIAGGNAQADAEEGGIAQAPLRRSQNRGFKKK